MGPVIDARRELTRKTRYRTLTDRLLGMRLVPSTRIVRREVSYEFMNRQMVWHAFTVSHVSQLYVAISDSFLRNSCFSFYPYSPGELYTA